MFNHVINRLNANVTLLALVGLTACGGGSGPSEIVATNAQNCTAPQTLNSMGVCVDPFPETNVGRCLTTYSNAPNARALLLDTEGVLVEFVNGSLVRSSLADSCFSEGDFITADVRPSSELTKPALPGDRAVSISNEEGFATIGTSDGFMAGAQIAIGAGTAQAEVRTITGLEPFTLDRPLEFRHEVSDVVVVTAVVTSPAS